MNKGPMQLNVMLKQFSSDDFKGLMFSQQWKLLQQAHLKSQPFWREHTYVHICMFIQSLRTKKIIETTVQLFFVLGAGLSSIFKLYPKDHPGTVTITSGDAAPTKI